MADHTANARHLISRGEGFLARYLENLEQDTQSSLDNRDATIAAQAEQIEQLKEHLRNLIWVVDNGDYPQNSIGNIRANEAHALLAELAK